MPLNPNGKIDKPALPFPDTAQAATAEPHRGPSATPTEETIRGIWSRILPNPPSPIPLDESFFDVGGHSILATRLIFEIRKAFLVEAPLGLVFDSPTIGALAASVDEIRTADLGFASKDGDTTAATTPTSPTSLTSTDLTKALKRTAAPRRVPYGEDYENLLLKLRPLYPAFPADYSSRPLTIFLTGATGFLGAFILRDLLSRPDRVKKVICLVRAPDANKALDRLRDAVTGRGVWNEDWVKTSRLEAVRGDLDQDLFGLEQSAWDHVADDADAVVHNGALVSTCAVPGCYVEIR